MAEVAARVSLWIVERLYVQSVVCSQADGSDFLPSDNGVALPHVPQIFQQFEHTRIRDNDFVHVDSK